MASVLVAMGVSASMASTIATVATVGSTVASVAGAGAAYKEGKQQEAEFKRQATESRLMGSIESERLRRESRQRQSVERTAMIESGAISGTGEGVLEQNSVAQELDALTVEYQGEQRGLAGDFQASQAKGSPLTIFTTAVRGFNQMDPLNLGN